MKIGVIAGSALPADEPGFPPPLGTDFGQTSSGILRMNAGPHDLLVISRHGVPPNIPPHMVNHRANVRSLMDAGVECLISICSTGALHSGMKVPGLTIPGDYIDLFSGATFHDGDIFHATPAIDRDILSALARSSRKVAPHTTDGTVYVQTRGPRLETRAEVRLLSEWGDVVGMNMGPEATLAAELGMRFGAILTVDNYANGVVDEALDFRDILDRAKMNWPLLLRVFSLLPERF